MYRKCLKPFLDFNFAFFGLIALSPLFCMVFIFLFFANRGSVFFFQKRPGIGGKLFTIMKFKTMNDKKDANGHLLPDAKRLTTIGKWIRNASLDELPQLVNVIKGDMSLVGPRPLLPEYLNFYTEPQKKRHNVKPGITGWAQINGRNAIGWDTKLKYDLWYIEQQSLGLDIKIIFKTLQKVFNVEDINATNSTIIEPFYGRK
ncbi:sugar transferase [Flavobacterium franklandianum]|uniref:sugar transferase n=1 Tax=Flavobacterium franklandianum TaxID=2594430 RepID=UPI0021CF6E26|nr:sugar transferase [Flavobacterium franklandianum]